MLNVGVVVDSLEVCQVDVKTRAVSEGVLTNRGQCRGIATSSKRCESSCSMFAACVTACTPFQYQGVLQGL